MVGGDGRELRAEGFSAVDAASGGVFLGLLRTPPRRADEYLRNLHAVVQQGLEKGQRLEAIAGPVDVSGAFRRRGWLLLLSDDRLQLISGKDWKQAVSVPREGLGVAEPTPQGTELQLPGGATFRVSMPSVVGANRNLGDMLNAFVLRGTDPRLRDRTTLANSYYLGGHDLPCVQGAKYELGFREDGVSVRLPDGSEVARLPLSDLRTFAVSGRGAYTTGGGFVGGGFGVRGALEGIVEARLLNALTTRRHVDTVLCLRTGTATGYWDHTVLTPRNAQIELSWFEDLLTGQAQRPPPSVLPSAPSGPSAADEIAKLGDLRAQGLLSDEEFAQLKASVIGRHLSSGST